MRYAGPVRNVMPGREGLHRDVLLGPADATGGRSAESHLTTGNLTFDTAPSQLDARRASVLTVEAGGSPRGWTQRPHVPGDGSWPVSSGGRQGHRTTSIRAMPSSAGRSKPHTCA
jgi:hypothetical protein